MPARLTPSGPGNISGNSVRTVARQVIGISTQIRIAGFVAFDFLRQFDHHAAAREIDRRHDCIGERQQHGRALRRRDLDDVASAEIMDRDDAAERLVAAVTAASPIRSA